MSEVIMIYSVVIGIFVGIGMALRITLSRIRNVLMIGKSANDLDDYSKEQIQIISAYVKEIP